MQRVGSAPGCVWGTLHAWPRVLAERRPRGTAASSGRALKVPALRPGRLPARKAWAEEHEEPGPALGRQISEPLTSSTRCKRTGWHGTSTPQPPTSPKGSVSSWLPLSSFLGARKWLRPLRVLEIQMKCEPNALFPRKWWAGCGVSGHPWGSWLMGTMPRRNLCPALLCNAAGPRGYVDHGEAASTQPQWPA